jgi:hypothetical protein
MKAGRGRRARPQTQATMGTARVLFACERRLKRAVKSLSRSIWNDGNGADSGPSRSDTWGRACRPIAVSTDAIRNVRLTSTLAVPFAQIPAISGAAWRQARRGVSNFAKSRSNWDHWSDVHQDAFLAPEIVKAAVEGRLPRGFGLKRLVDLPMAWPDQWTALGLQAPAQA